MSATRALLLTAITLLLSACGNNKSENINLRLPALTFMADKTNAELDTSRVHFIATHYINFDKTRTSWGRKPINIQALNSKKDRALFLLDSIVNTPQFADSVANFHFSNTE